MNLVHQFLIRIPKPKFEFKTKKKKNKMEKEKEERNLTTARPTRLHGPASPTALAISPSAHARGP
jgi:hypothetical protein